MQLCSIHSYIAEVATTRTIHYYPNPGNAGDALIAQATLQIFQRNQVNYRWIDRNHFTPQGKVVVYSGGGNLTRYYDVARQSIAKIHHEVEKLIILPHTIEGNEDLLSTLGANVDIICRERISYEHVRHHAKQANVYLADDMAFHLNIDDLLATPQFHRLWHRSLDATLLIRALYTRNFGQLTNYLRAHDRMKRTGILHAFRLDVERSLVEIPTDNCDISEIASHGTHSEPAVSSSAIHLLRLVGNCDQLRTNRLHVAIAGALLGKEVWFYPNSYFKNHAIYAFSMQSHYPNVRWMGR